MGPALCIDGLVQTFDDGAGSPRQVLNIHHLNLKPAARIAIRGPSGAGKSSLLHLLAGIDRPRQGRIIWGDTIISNLSETARDQWRARNLGLVFQDFHLIEGLSPVENVLVTERFSKFAASSDKIRHAEQLMQRVGLDPKARRIDTMSRGERQRLAVARAVLQSPGIILADEPTASLDPVSGIAVGRLLVDLATEIGASLIVVTHDHALGALLDQRYDLIDGNLMAAQS